MSYTCFMHSCVHTIETRCVLFKCLRSLLVIHIFCIGYSDNEPIPGGFWSLNSLSFNAERGISCFTQIEYIILFISISDSFQNYLTRRQLQSTRIYEYNCLTFIFVYSYCMCSMYSIVPNVRIIIINSKYNNNIINII